MTFFAAGAGNTQIDATADMWAHTHNAGDSIISGWDLEAEQSVGLVNPASGILNSAALMIIRHSDGCARAPSTST